MTPKEAKVATPARAPPPGAKAKAGATPPSKGTPVPTTPGGNGTPGPGTEHPDLRKLFEIWVDSELKAQVVIFFNNNPGVIETVEGLARRLGMNPEALRDAVADHVRLGLLQERKMGDKTVLVFNRSRRGEIEDLVIETLRRRLEAAS